MLEATADWLAATKQRGGGPLTDRLVNVLPKSKPHPRLIPFLRNGLKAAHELYLEIPLIPIRIVSSKTCLAGIVRSKRCLERTGLFSSNTRWIVPNSPQLKVQIAIPDRSLCAHEIFHP